MERAQLGTWHHLGFVDQYLVQGALLDHVQHALVSSIAQVTRCSIMVISASDEQSAMTCLTDFVAP